jgi:hypothetical protein
VLDDDQFEDAKSNVSRTASFAWCIKNMCSCRDLIWLWCCSKTSLASVVHNMVRNYNIGLPVTSSINCMCDGISFRIMFNVKWDQFCFTLYFTDDFITVFSSFWLQGEFESSIYSTLISLCHIVTWLEEWAHATSWQS